MFLLKATVTQPTITRESGLCISPLLLCVGKRFQEQDPQWLSVCCENVELYQTHQTNLTSGPKGAGRWPVPIWRRREVTPLTTQLLLIQIHWPHCWLHLIGWPLTLYAHHRQIHTHTYTNLLISRANHFPKPPGLLFSQTGRLRWEVGRLRVGDGDLPSISASKMKVNQVNPNPPLLPCPQLKQKPGYHSECSVQNTHDNCMIDWDWQTAMYM